MKWKEALAGVLAAALTVNPSFGSGANPFQTKLPKDKQILNALDRLTFGPRPGDFERVRKTGLKPWIEQQLHPERIAENPYLEAKLVPLLSLRMSSAEVAQHYPSPQQIKAIADGRRPLPDEPVLRASVERLVARYKAKKGAGGDVSDKLDDLEPVRTLDEVVSPEQIKILRTGTNDQKKQLLNQLPAGQLDDLVIAMPPPLRQQVFNAAPADLRRKILMLRSPQQVVAYDLLESKLLRAIYSNRQLAEELDDFWFNHFNVFYEKGADRFQVPSYERDAIRPHVLGRFRDLLEATAKSPAMLFYLDNFQSVRADLDVKAKGKRARRGLNENYARELMELHTLGVNGGYTQHDVVEVARCFTGWGIEQPQMGGAFFYNDKVHDKGQKVVLGHVIPAGGGMEDGEQVLDILAAQPATAKFICRELAQRFVADNPPQSLLDRMTATFLSRNGDIREVMRTMLFSKEFASAGTYRAKVKTPFEMVASAVRSLDANVDDAYALANQIGQLGEPLYRKLEPTGYSNVNADWVNSAALLGRMNFALNLAQNKVPGVKVDMKKFEGADPGRIAAALLIRDLSPQTRATIGNALKNNDAKAADKAQTPASALVAGLMLGSPEFQRR